MCPLNETNKVQKNNSISVDIAEDDHIKNNPESHDGLDRQMVDEASPESRSGKVMHDVVEEIQYESGMVKDTQCNYVSSSCKSPSEPKCANKESIISKKPQTFRCERCNEGFSGMAALRQHCRALHGDQKYYKCNVCSKLFSHPSSRNIHLRLHSGEKPYKCETCGKRFRVSSHLKDHIRVHTGERPYVCDICQKGFKQSSDLKKHRRTHTLDKPYKCPLCPSAFTRSHHCQGHINSVHKFLKCGTCSALFTTEEDFNKHKELHPMVKVQSIVCGKEARELIAAGAKVHAVAPNVHLKEVPKTDKLELQETKVSKESWQMAPPNVYLYNCIPRSRENIALAEFMASMAAQRSAEWSNNLVEKQMPKTKCLPAISDTLIIQKQAGRGEAKHCTEQFHRDNASKIDSPFWAKRNEEKVSIMADKNALRNDTKESTVFIEQNPFWITNSETPHSLPRRVVNNIGKREMPLPRCVPLVIQEMSPKKMEMQHSKLPVDASRTSSNKGETEILSKEHNIRQCHRVSVIHFHSSTASSCKISPVKGTNQSKEDLNGNLKINNSEESSESRSSSPKRSSIGEDRGKTGGADVRFAYCETSHPQVLSGYNEPFIPADDRTIGEHYNAPGILRKKPMDFFSEDLFFEHHQRHKTSWAGGPDDVTNSRKRVYPFLSASTAEGTITGSTFLKSERLPMEKVIKMENMKVEITPEPDQDVIKDDPEYEYSCLDSPLTSKESLYLTSKSSEETEDENDSDNHDENESKSRFVTIAPKPEQKKAKVVEYDKPYKCTVCSKCFSRASLLKQHSVIHQGNKRFKFECETCQKMFRTRSHLRDHVRIHTGERPFKCHICARAFKQSSDLKKHINLHTGANQFKCEECNMEFRRADALRKHKLSHQTEGSFVCDYCGHEFEHIGALQQHQIIHTGTSNRQAARPLLRCNYCFKTFSRTKEESFQVHCEMHRQELKVSSISAPAVKCTICYLTFTGEAELGDHMNIHTGNKPYKCIVCSKEFCISVHLKEHLRVHSDAVTLRADT